jgi:chemosensory pili system protein ChpA (sensor histidine kinase/response regulator)
MESEFLQGFLAQAKNGLPMIYSGILACVQTGNAYGELNTSLRQASAIKDAALIVELEETARIAGELEERLKDYAAVKVPLTGGQSRELLDKLAELEAAITQLNFDSDDFFPQVTDRLEASFESSDLSEPPLKLIAETTEHIAEEEIAAEEWEEEFEIDDEMLAIFSEEAEELIQNIRVNLQRLEKDANDREALQEVRRKAHTLKGSAGIVGLKVLSTVAHRVEDLLDYLADNEIDGNEKIFELLLTSTDCFAALASNETSVQLTKKIELLYKNFDALLTALKSAGLSFEIADSGVQNQDRSEMPNLISETGEEQRTRCDTQTSDRQHTTNTELTSRELRPDLLPEISAHKSIVRVSLEKLDDMVKIMSGMVVSRSVFEQRLAELEQQIGELHNSTRRLSQATHKIETDFEADMLRGGNRQSTMAGRQLSVVGRQSSISQSQIENSKSFDSLELDRYTEFHQTMRELIETTGDTSAISSELDSLKGNLEMLFDNQRRLIEEMQDKLLRLRMVSFGSLSVRLQRTVRVTADEEGKKVELSIEGENLEVDTQILDSIIETLLHLLRNAVAHGIESPETRRLLGKPETGQIKVRVHDEGTHFILNVSDDGRGISAAALKAKAVQNDFISEAVAEKMTEQEAFALVFQAGLTTSDEISQVSGRGVGMNIVKTAVARQQGTISIDSETHKGTTFTVRLPMALAVTRALLVKTAERTSALPLKFVRKITKISADELLQAENQKFFEFSETKYTFSNLGEILGLSADDSKNDENIPLLLVEVAGNRYALRVDEIIKSEEIVIKPLGNTLRGLREYLGATILGDGSVVPVIDLIYLLKRDVRNPGVKIQNQEDFLANKVQSSKTKNQKPLNILIVDDSPSVRHLTSNIIKNAGWTAIVAKDGLEALDILQDLRELPVVILSDVEMPRMNGYELLASLKKQANLQQIPVVMITSRANQKHQQKAVDLGVTEYLTKPFDDAKLIETIRNLTA